MYTIGHGNRQIEDFLNLLTNNEINLLVDIRSIPFSRFYPHFNKPKLEMHLQSVNIKYLFLGNELGGRPKDPGLYLNGKVDYNLIKTSNAFKNGVQELIELSKQDIKVTLMCSELSQNECHRKVLVAEELVDHGVDIFHINKLGKLEKHLTFKGLFA